MRGLEARAHGTRHGAHQVAGEDPRAIGLDSRVQVVVDDPEDPRPITHCAWLNCEQLYASEYGKPLSPSRYRLARSAVQMVKTYEDRRGEYHAEWDEEKLEPWKEVVRQLLRHHAGDPHGHLGQISTEFIPNRDYGEGCRYSLFEQGIACTQWMRDEWDRIRKPG